MPGTYYNEVENKCTRAIGQTWTITNGKWWGTDYWITERHQCPRFSKIQSILPNLNTEEVVSFKKIRCACDYDLIPSDYPFRCVVKPEDCPNYDIDCNLFHGRTECQDLNKPETCTCPEGSVWNSTTEFCFSDTNCISLLAIVSLEESEYDPIERACISPLNTLCNPLSLKMKCPRNAKCQRIDNSYYCKCDDGFIQGNASNICVLGKDIGEGCIDIWECRKPLICDSTCMCPEESIWDAISKVCYLPVNHICVGEDDSNCGPGSKCEYRRYDMPYFEQGWHCNCKPGYLEDKSTGRCFGVHGTECLENRDCYASLACFNGKCECSHLATLGSTIVSKDGLCKIYAGGSCTTGSSLCTKYSTCINGTCICESGYVPNFNGECLIGYNQPCVIDFGGINCNYDQGLACSDQGKCECIDPNLTYIPGNGCSGNENSLCGFVKATTQAKYSNYFIGCTNNLTCSEKSRTRWTCSRDSNSIHVASSPQE